jgi:AraC family transcriptional regulator, arabinose operon regulatory protein
MIHITGNAWRDWPEHGVERLDSYITVSCSGYQKMITRDLTRNREQGRLDYQLIYVVGGKGIFQFDGQPVEVGAGSIVVYEPRQVQQYSFYADDSPEVYWIHFTGYGARDCLGQLGLLGCQVSNVGMVEEAGELFKCIIHELNMNKPLSGHLAAAYLMEMLAHLGRRLAFREVHRSPEPHEDIHHIIAFMHEQYMANLTVRDLAERCNLSLFRFIHKFKAVTGTTPMKYRTAIRINEAKKLLSETSLPVSEVACIVGYDNPLYFSRVFCHMVGMPPTRYKSQSLCSHASFE